MPQSPRKNDHKLSSLRNVTGCHLSLSVTVLYSSELSSSLTTPRSEPLTSLLSSTGILRLLSLIISSHPFFSPASSKKIFSSFFPEISKCLEGHLFVWEFFWAPKSRHHKMSAFFHLHRFPFLGGIDPSILRISSWEFLPRHHDLEHYSHKQPARPD